MKKTIILSIAILILAAACREEKLPTWSGDDRIRFTTDNVNDTLQSYSFLGAESDITQYMMEIKVKVEGEVRNFPRTVALKQVATGNNDAVAGTHYVAFDNAQVKEHYVIPAGKADAVFPVILLRHPSLIDDEKILRIELVENEHFQLSTYNLLIFRRITFAEKPSMPDAWNAVGTTSNTTPYFGVYGPVKHRFMIEITNMAFDNAWFTEYFYWANEASGTIPRDSGYASYLRQLLQRKLDERNAEAGAGNELKEADGTIVRFL